MAFGVAFGAALGALGGLDALDARGDLIFAVVFGVLRVLTARRFISRTTA